MHWLSYCFNMVFTADDKQLINCLRQLKGYSSRRFLKQFLPKIRHAEDLTTCLRIWDCGKSSKQWATAHWMYCLATQSQNRYD